MVQSRSCSRTPPHSYRRRDSADRDHRRRCSRKHDRCQTRRHHRSISSPSSTRSTSGCSSCPTTPKRCYRPVDPPANKCLGVFGLSSNTKETDLMNVFAKYGIIEKATIVYDAKTKMSRGFGFVYYQELNAASAAKVECNGMILHDRTIRVDYSVTERPHTPTPGVYMGDRSTGKRRYRSSYSYRGRSYDNDHHHRHPKRSCSRSPRRHRRTRHRHGHRRYRSRDRASSYSSVDSRRSYR